MAKGTEQSSSLLTRTKNWIDRLDENTPEARRKRAAIAKVFKVIGFIVFVIPILIFRSLVSLSMRK